MDDQFVLGLASRIVSCCNLGQLSADSSDQEKYGIKNNRQNNAVFVYLDVPGSICILLVQKKELHIEARARLMPVGSSRRKFANVKFVNVRSYRLSLNPSDTLQKPLAEKRAVWKLYPRSRLVPSDTGSFSCCVFLAYEKWRGLIPVFFEARDQSGTFNAETLGRTLFSAKTPFCFF